MADAFGAIGFEPQKSKKGLQSFAKELTKDFSLFIEADPATFERDYGNEAISPLRYWPTIAFDGVAYLGATNKKDKSRHITFLPIMNCVAATRLQGYDDTRSLEVMIRGQALWHKLAIGPLERAILELS